MTKRPFMVEFIGTPEAGKTTTILSLEKRFSSTSYKVTRIRETAETVPPELPKGSWHANLHMKYSCVCNLLVNLYQDNDITLIDRGLYDVKFWGRLFLKNEVCSEKEYNSYMAVVCEHLRFNVDLVVALTTCPQEAIRRRGGEGRIVTLPFVENYNRCFFDFYQSITDVPKVLIDTTGIPQEQIVSSVYDTILSYYYEHTP